METLHITFFLLVFITCTQSITFLGRSTTYSRFPKWNACINSSLSFDFKTTSSSEQLLMYTDDNGRYDFFQLALVAGQVRLWMNLADEQDGVVELLVGKALNNGDWHHVKVKRNRMNTTLFVDSYQSSMMSFGPDFQFGDIYENNYVYFGGIPGGVNTETLKGLALPSSKLLSQFTGQIRNILYFNCSCVPVRAEVIDSRGVTRTPREACEVSNPCPTDCPCISFDQGPACGECYSSAQCANQFTTKYYLPMDRISGRDLENPSGLDSRVFGNPSLVEGVFRRALKLDGRTQYARVTGPGHKKECFGNLDHCTQGYYLGMWLKFEDVDRRGVYLSNGGHRSDSHGVAMYYSKGKLEYTFKKPDGSEWKVNYDNLLEGRWYHVAATWTEDIGLMLYINGELVNHDSSITKRRAASKLSTYNDFVLGRANDRSGTERLGKLVVDEFQFASMYKTSKEIKESGAFYRYYFDMDRIQNDRLISPNMDAAVYGQADIIPGKVNNALRLGHNGGKDYVSLGNVEDTCLGDLTSCKYGIYLSFWVSFKRLDADTRYLFSSPKGINVYSVDNRLHATASMMDRFWDTYFVGLRTGLWFFVEVSWRRDRGLALYVNGELVSQKTTDSHKASKTTKDKNFYIGRANEPEAWQKTAVAVVDDVQIYYADMESLLNVDFIQRGRPMMHMFDMDSKDGNRLLHGSIFVSLRGNPKLVKGKLGRAIMLNGRNQYVDFGDHVKDCFGNLDNCKHGATVAFWMRPDRLTKDAYFLWTGDNGLAMWYKGKKMHVSAKTSTNEWTLSTDELRPDQWYMTEVTWSEDNGLKLWVNNEVVAEDKVARQRTEPQGDDGRVYLGKSNMPDGKNGAATFDEMEYWFSDRDYLNAWGYIQRGRPTHYIIDMEEIQGVRLIHATLPIRVVGDAKLIPGKIGNALQLTGADQYLDIGDHSDECMGNLEKCMQGITISAWMRFKRFTNNMVFMSTGIHGIVMLYRNGYIHVSANGKTEVTIQPLETNRWYYVEISWHPVYGLSLFVDGNLVASSKNTLGSDVSSESRSGSFYLGRPNSGDVRGGRFVHGHFDVDDMEIWYARRASLLANDYIKPKVGYITTQRPPVVVTSARERTTTIIRFDNGLGYVEYNFNKLPSNFLRRVDDENVAFYFLTDKKEGLLWLQQDRNRIMHLSMQDGYLRFVNDEEPYGPQATTVIPANGRRLNDWRWHHVNITRKGRDINIVVDNQHEARYTFPSSRKIQFLVPAEVWLGGHPEIRDATNKLVDIGLNGGIAEVVYTTRRPGETTEVNLIATGTPNVHGPVRFVNGSLGGGYVTDRPPVIRTRPPILTFPTRRPTPRPTPRPTRPPKIGPTPVTFRSSTVYMPLERIRLNRGSIISFKFQTINDHGLMLYTHGHSTRPGVFIALEIYDGRLYFVYDLGSVTRRILLSERDITDGLQHSVEVRFYKDFIILMLDGEQKRITLTAQERLPIEFTSPLFIGGYTTYSNDVNERGRLPWYIWSRDGYQGCLEDLKVNQEQLNLHQPVHDQFLFGYVDRQCLAMPRQCTLNQRPCVNGICQDSWDGYSCDCTSTGFSGRNCERLALSAVLDGTHYGFVPLRVFGSHVNDLSMRFKTPLSNTFLFQTYTGESNEYLRAQIDNGRLKVTTNLGGTVKTYYAGDSLNDLDWHTLYVRRRGNHIAVWVDDDQPPKPGQLDGENFYFDIEKIYMGSLTDSGITVGNSGNNYIGYIQNFHINDLDLLEKLQGIGTHTINFPIAPLPNLPKLTHNPITITSASTFVQLETLRVPPRMVLSFMFKTKESSGVIFFNGGRNGEFIAGELYKGSFHFLFNTSDSAPALRVYTPQPLNDNKWHQVTIKRDTDEKGFVVIVDGHTSILKSDAHDATLDLQGHLYIGGLPKRMFEQEYTQNALLSQSGFKGCLASVHLSGGVPDLLKYSRGNTFIVSGCSDIIAVCAQDSCKNNGVCIPSGLGYYCDCNMTSFVGTSCTEQAVGFRFMEHNENGLLVYTFPSLLRPDTMYDNISFGFMTYDKNGVLMRIQSAFLGDFIELRLVDGYVVAEYSTDSSQETYKLMQSAKRFNDGKYHVVRFLRNSGGATLNVDSFGTIAKIHSGHHDIFDKQGTIYIGGDLQDRSGGATIGEASIVRSFNGIIAGMHLNGLRVLDKAKVKDNTMWLYDVAVAPPPFTLTPGISVPTQPPWITPKPAVVVPVVPGGGGVIVPGDVGGGGVGWVSGGSGIAIGTYPDKAGGTGVIVPGHLPIQAAALAAPPLLPPHGPRAGAVMGTILGIMALLSSLMWAFYRCKPGWCACLKPPAAAGGVSVISPPRAGTNLAAFQAAKGAGTGAGGAGMGSGAGSGGAMAVGSAGAGAGGGGSSSSYFFTEQSKSASGGGAGAGGGSGAGYDSSTLRATGTFTNAGTTIGTPKPSRAHLGSTASGTSGYSYQQNTMRSVVDGSVFTPGPASAQTYHYERSGEADYDMTTGMSGANYQSNTLSAGGGASLGGGSLGGGGYSTSTMASNYNYQVQTVRTVTGQEQMLGYAGSPNFAVTPGAMGEEVRVDCCLMTTDGKSVVTGSSLGPPQVWDMQSGELLRIMKGGQVGSTNLHLACNDRLLVGAVNADLEVNQFSHGKGVTNRMLQIWDFTTGKPLEMAEHEYCSALCVMTDGDKVVFGKTDKYGNGTSVVVWDLLGNQPIKEMRYDAPIGNNDYISYLNLSQNDRYVIAGFNNTFDNHAEFVIFDMTLTSYNVMEPSFRRLDANAECTAVLPRDEAITGLRNGDLVVWSLRTGEASRQLVSGSSSHAHSKEVKAVVMSEDNRFLVSAGADGLVKVWDMNTERQMHTLAGHTDEVWCVAVSPDSEIIVSGSRDGTIRLWRLRNGTEICSFGTGVDVFYITMSHDKSTIVALGDKFGARKLIMLQVVRTKIRRQVSS